MSENVENLSVELSNTGERANRAAECFTGSVEGFGKAEDMTAGDCLESVARGFSRWLRERGDDAGELAAAALNAVQELGVERNELVTKVVEALKTCEHLLREGAEKLSSEQGEALVSLLALAVLLCARPEQACALVHEKPELLARAISVLCRN
jgi:hypothetical protein